MAAAMDTQEIKKEQEGYQTAFKATALFGGVQVINILVSILKSKIVALWLGTTGFGIMSLFNSATIFHNESGAAGQCGSGHCLCERTKQPFVSCTYRESY